MSMKREDGVVKEEGEASAVTIAVRGSAEGGVVKANKGMILISEEECGVLSRSCNRPYHSHGSPPGSS